MTSDPALRERLAAVLARHPEVRLALLFGSRATGRERPGSDLDIAVDGGDIDRLELVRELGEAAGCEVDVVSLRRASYPLLKALLRDSILLHEGEPHAAARWRTGAIIQTEADRPWFERMRDAYLQRLAEEANGR